jgi:HlyD family secretion protein
MRKIIRITVFSLIGILFLGTMFFLYNKSKKKPVVFETRTPAKATIVKKTVVTGSVIPRREIQIVPQVSGIIEEIYVVPGQKIKKGDLIAKVKIIPNMVQLNEAEARLRRAKIALEDAKIEYDRQKKLYDDKVIPVAEFLQSKSRYEGAQSDVTSAENNLEIIREGVTKDSKTASNTLIRSTIEGTILDVPVKEGNSVIETNTFNAGTNIASVADMTDMIFKGKVDETEVGKISENMKIKLTIGAIENSSLDATVEYISPKGAEENGTIQFEIRAKVAVTTKNIIRAGYSANAEIETARRDSVLAIDESLLLFSHDSTFVEIEKTPQVFTKKYIKTGLSDGVKIEVLDGLKIKDKIKVLK